LVGTPPLGLGLGRIEGFGLVVLLEVPGVATGRLVTLPPFTGPASSPSLRHPANKTNNKLNIRMVIILFMRIMGIPPFYCLFLFYNLVNGFLLIFVAY
jgi:hypothetical protein